MQNGYVDLSWGFFLVTGSAEGVWWKIFLCCVFSKPLLFVPLFDRKSVLCC